MMPMKFGSVCSGIEAASMAWRPLGWEAAWLSEIEPFPCALLAHHYPDVPNLGDMTKFEDWPDDEKHSIDVLCGGTPCQSFSFAGLRKGLDDPRGGLMLTFGAIAAKYRPQWLVWENVPGVLSSNGGQDFASFLGLITGQEVKVPEGGWANSGLVSGIPDAYGVAFRVLDAQYFGVAQQRRRVFVVGCLGDWRGSAAVLFERHSLQGHPAPRRGARKEIAPTIRAGSSSSNDELITIHAPAIGPASGGMQVRRFIVEECEFLQGFPRGYTAIPWRKKPADQCPDGPRYKAIGNSWAVPCARWIGERIAEIHGRFDE